jgi:hypothetical protein
MFITATAHSPVLPRIEASTKAAFILLITTLQTQQFTVRSLTTANYEGHLERKERFAIKKYLLIIGKKKNMQILSHTFTYFST